MANKHICENIRTPRTNFYWVIYTVEAPNVPIFLMGILNKWRTIGLCNLNTHEGEEMAFIEQRSREAL